MEVDNNFSKNNNQDKKKMIISIIVGIVTLLVLVIGSTYAYFQVNTTSNNTPSNLIIKTPKLGIATIKQGISNLHLNLTALDMSENNKGRGYYADDVKNYVDNNVDGTHIISSVQITDGDDEINYTCSVDIAVTLTTSNGSMGSVLQQGDVILKIEGNVIDLYELKSNNTKTINLKFNMIGNDTKEIGAYAKLINKETNQNHLVEKALNVNIKTQNIKCNAVNDSKIAQLRNKDTNGNLSNNLVGGMYRYQGTDNVQNWICFGTTENCGTSEELIDRYMYRIIGITPEGELYLIKETVLKEENSVLVASWNNVCKFSQPYTGVDSTKCDGENCDWPNSILFKRINGTSNGTTVGGKGVTDIFVDNNTYEYLKSGDGSGTNNTSKSSWYNLISDHEWMYGDTYINGSYNGDTIYAIENGGITQRYWPNINQTCNSSTPCELKDYTWPSTNKILSKVGLMYIHDYYYAYYDDNEASRGNPGSYANLVKSWIFFQKDGYNKSSNYEWLITRSTNATGILVAWFIRNSGRVDNSGDFCSGSPLRPTFYLIKDAKIKSDGEGTKTNPFILDVN